VVAPISRLGVERIDDSVAVVAMHGEHDLNDAAELREQLDSLLREGRAVVVDLAEATFVDSSILAVLLEVMNDAKEADVGFALALIPDGPEGVRRVVEVTGLDAAMPIHPSREEAVAAVRTRGGGG
jgi:anti-sigma B factor antagonist